MELEAKTGIELHCAYLGYVCRISFLFLFCYLAWTALTDYTCLRKPFHVCRRFGIPHLTSDPRSSLDIFISNSLQLPIPQSLVCYERICTHTARYYLILYPTVEAQIMILAIRVNHSKNLACRRACAA